MTSEPSSLNAQYGGNHYKILEIQPVEYCHKNKIPFIEGNAIKYLTRHQSKGKAEDLKKAIHFAQMALELNYGINSDVTYWEKEPKEENGS